MPGTTREGQIDSVRAHIRNYISGLSWYCQNENFDTELAKQMCDNLKEDFDLLERLRDE